MTESSLQIGAATNKIGNGTYGTVYATADQKYAIKSINIPEEEEDLNVILRELEIMRLISTNAPDIPLLRLLDVFMKDSCICLVSPIYHCNLHTYIISTNPIIELTKYIFTQVLIGMNYFHKNMKWCHGDLKPENILVDKDAKVVKICDFGLSSPLSKFNQRTG